MVLLNFGLAIHAQARERYRLQPRLHDVFLAVTTDPVRAVLKPLLVFLACFFINFVDPMAFFMPAVSRLPRTARIVPDASCRRPHPPSTASNVRICRRKPG